jgi:hypothetical protein
VEITFIKASSSSCFSIAKSRGIVVLNYYLLLSTEGPEKQQQTGLVLGSSEYSNRQQYVSARLKKLTPCEAHQITANTRLAPHRTRTIWLEMSPFIPGHRWSARLRLAGRKSLLQRWGDYRCTARKGPFCICGDVPTKCYRQNG